MRHRSHTNTIRRWERTQNYKERLEKRSKDLFEMINSQQATDWLVTCLNDINVGEVRQVKDPKSNLFTVSVLDTKGKELACGIGPTLGGAFTECAMKFHTPRNLR